MATLYSLSRSQLCSLRMDTVTGKEKSSSNINNISTKSNVTDIILGEIKVILDLNLEYFFIVVNAARMQLFRK
jgi:hypothetical protein